MYLHTHTTTRTHVSQLHLIIKRHVNLMSPSYRYNNVSFLKNIHVWFTWVKLSDLRWEVVINCIFDSRF